MQQQKNELGKQLVERNLDVTVMVDKNIEVCCCLFTLPIYCTLMLLTFLQKLRCQHDAKNEQDKAAKKRRKTFKEKRRTVAREADKSRKDASDVITAHRKTRQSATRQSKIGQ